MNTAEPCGDSAPGAACPRPAVAARERRDCISHRPPRRGAALPHALERPRGPGARLPRRSAFERRREAAACAMASRLHLLGLLLCAAASVGLSASRSSTKKPIIGKGAAGRTPLPRPEPRQGARMDRAETQLMAP